MIPRFLSGCRSFTYRVKPLGLKPRRIVQLRFLSTSDGDSGEKDTLKGGTTDSVKDDDIFGVNYEDGEDRMGPSSDYPPILKRDTTTGRVTGEENQMSDKDRSVLSASGSEQEASILGRVEEHWKNQGENWASELGRRVREADMGLNVLGRSPKAQATTEVPNDDMMKKTQAGKRSGRFSQRLTSEEFESFREYMKTRRWRAVIKGPTGTLSC